MKRTILIAVVAVAVLTLAMAASAEPIMKPNIIKIGAAWPTNGDVRDQTGSLAFYAGFERVFAEMPDSRSDITGEVGWSHDSGEFDGDHYKTRVIPVLVNWRQHAAGGGMAGTSFFYGIGAGAYFVRSEVDGDVTNKTKIGFAPLVGIEGDNWQAELKYHFIGKIEGERADSLVLAAGLRF